MEPQYRADAISGLSRMDLHHSSNVQCGGSFRRITLIRHVWRSPELSLTTIKPCAFTSRTLCDSMFAQYTMQRPNSKYPR